MPDYFRSQRQIIIDTGSFLASTIHHRATFQCDFPMKLATDQKLLRFGAMDKYLGEEFLKFGWRCAMEETDRPICWQVSGMIMHQEDEGAGWLSSSYS